MASESSHLADSKSLQRLAAYSSREWKEVLRDPIRLAFAFFGSMILLFIFAYGISMDVDDLTFAAYDLDQTPESRAYLNNFRGSRYFIEQPPVASLDALEERLVANDITLAIEIPSGFGKALVSGQPTEVAAWIDGATPSTASTVEGYVTGGHQQFLSEFYRAQGLDPPGSDLVEVEVRYQYNPSFETIYTIAPSVPGILLMLIPAILMAVSVAREREGGTITNFYVTPTRRLEFLIGKQLPYVAIGMANFALMTLAGVYLFDVPLRGSLGALVIGAVVYLFASTGVGLLTSSFTKSQVSAVFATAVIAMIPTVQFSGMMQPVSTLEGAARTVGYFWPTGYYMQMSVGAFTKALSFRELAPNIAILLAFPPIIWIVSALLLKKQER